MPILFFARATEHMFGYIRGYIRKFFKNCADKKIGYTRFRARESHFLSLFRVEQMF